MSNVDYLKDSNINAESGVDILKLSGGRDAVVYSTADDSTISIHDVLSGFSVGNGDNFDLQALFDEPVSNVQVLNLGEPLSGVVDEFTGHVVVFDDGFDSNVYVDASRNGFLDVGDVYVKILGSGLSLTADNFYL